jgi:hypothetical protein
MIIHKDTGVRCAVMHHDGYGPCIVCECNAHVRPHEWREHIGFAVEALSAKRDAEAAVIEAAKAFVQTPRLVSEAALKDAVLTLRALEGDA